MPAAPNSSHLEAGGLISGRYRVMGMLGQGGMSKVYLAEDTHLSRNVALKVIQPGQTANAQEFQFLRNALLQEARLAGRLNHPNIVTIYDSFELGDLVCVSMEYVQGLTLERTMDDERLNESAGGREFSFYFLLHGVVQHNLYHAGQIALLKKAGA